MRRAGSNVLSASRHVSVKPIATGMYEFVAAGKAGSTIEPCRNVVSTTRATPPLFESVGSTVARSA